MNEEVVTETEVKKPRRYLSASYKRRVAIEYEKADKGQKGVILRREGLYSSSVREWIRLKNNGKLKPASQINAKKEDKKIAFVDKSKLKNENNKLKHKLKQAETVIELQKKIYELFGENMNLLETPD